MDRSIFISHSSKDKPIIKKFIDVLTNGFEIKAKNIFCTSAEGTKISSGVDWRKDIQEHLLTAKVIILIITSNYKESEICLNEMGVAWVSTNLVIPFIIEPIDFKNAGAIIDVRQIERLNDGGALDRLKDTLEDNKIIEDIRTERWTVKKQEFLDYLKDYLTNNKFESPISRTELNKLEVENKNLQEGIKLLNDERKELQKENEKLRKLKDKEAIKELDKKSGKLTDILLFKELKNNISEILRDFQPIVRGIMYKDYSGKDVHIEADNYPNEISQAIAKNYIDAEEGWTVHWNRNRNLRDLQKYLHDLNNLMNNSDSSKLLDWIEEEYDCEPELNNIEFWESIFKVNVYLS